MIRCQLPTDTPGLTPRPDSHFADFENSSPFWNNSLKINLKDCVDFYYKKGKVEIVMVFYFGHLNVFFFALNDFLT